MNNKRAAVGLILFFLLLGLFMAACAGEPDTELVAMQATVAALSAQVAEQAGVIVPRATVEALSTQVAEQAAGIVPRATVEALSTRVAGQAGVIATQEAFIIYLATRPAMLITPVGPDTPPTPYWPVMGRVQIENGRCCVGGTAGEPLQIMIDLQAESPQSEVTDMLLAVGSRFLNEEEMEGLPWEPFTAQKTVTIPVPLNWSGSYASVQFRDADGGLSQVVQDDVSVEGSEQ